MSARRSCSACWPVIKASLATVALLSAGLSAGLAPDTALAKRPGAAEPPEIARCIRVAARGHPWLEKTLWGLRDQEAGWLGAEVANTNGTHDLGPLQINSWWVPHIARLIGKPDYQVRHWLRHDACFNADAARWIFLSGLRTTGDYWKAIGIYHSPTAWRQRTYAAKVANHMRARFGPSLFGTGSAEARR
ncbi:lytic transglycosylase domain-containing protein [Novosphingobium lubricantis]|nr:lytic transglycosylase domain-containing protein [Novosphingobium sp. CCH12-A3]